MNTLSHDFVTVDMRGLKAGLVTRARAQRVSVSVLVRAAVARELGLSDPAKVVQHPAVSASTVKLSIRFTLAEAACLTSGAKAAGLSRGPYLDGLMANVPVITGGSNRVDCLGALTTSCAELSTLTRNLHHLSTLLRQGSVRAAQEYREMLDTLAGDVRSHLALATGLLADFRPRSSSASRPTLEQR